MRIGIAPLLLVLVGTAAHVHIPPAYVLISAMPTAFHPLVLARINGLPTAVVRTCIVVSSLLVISATCVYVLLR